MSKAYPLFQTCFVGFVLSIGSGFFLLSFQGIFYMLICLIKEAFFFIGYGWMCGFDWHIFWVWWFYICVAFVCIKALSFYSISKAFDSFFSFRIGVFVPILGFFIEIFIFFWWMQGLLFGIIIIRRFDSEGFFWLISLI